MRGSRALTHAPADAAEEPFGDHVKLICRRHQRDQQRVKLVGMVLVPLQTTLECWHQLAYVNLEVLHNERHGRVEAGRIPSEAFNEGSRVPYIRGHLLDDLAEVFVEGRILTRPHSDVRLGDGGKTEGQEWFTCKWEATSS